MNSIRTRLLVWLIIPLSLIAALVSFETFFTSRTTSNELHDRTLFGVMLMISENVVATNGDVLAENILEVLTENLGDQFFYHVAGPNNSFVTGYTGRPRLPEGVALRGGKPVFYDAVHRGDPVRVVAMRQLITQRELNGWTTITTWQRVSQRKALTYRLFGYSLLRLLLVTICAGIIIWFAISKGLKPIQDLRQAIEKRSPFDLTPIKREMPVELHGIVGSMNDLLARVARSKANRERFVGDAAHQLRNPIAALKTQAETALQSRGENQLRNDLSGIVEITNQTGRMVEQMLASARANALEFDIDETFDINDTVSEAARVIAPAALSKRQDFSFEKAATPVLVSGNRVLVQEAICNLVDNAIKHSPTGSNIFVQIAQGENKNAVKICVYDEGPPFSPEDLLRLSQPFATGETNSAGSGLGLSIARDVAKAHGGHLEVSSCSEGKGKQIVLTLPLAKSL